MLFLKTSRQRFSGLGLGAVLSERAKEAYVVLKHPPFPERLDFKQCVM